MIELLALWVILNEQRRLQEAEEEEERQKIEETEKRKSN